MFWTFMIGVGIGMLVSILRLNHIQSSDPQYFIDWLTEIKEKNVMSSEDIATIDK